MKCQNAACAAENPAAARFCGRCGTALEPDLRVRGTRPAPPVERVGGGAGALAPTAKSPVLAAVLSGVVVGLGQLYNDEGKKALVMFGAAFVGAALTVGLAWFAVAVWSAIDAYRVAEGTGNRWS